MLVFPVFPKPDNRLSLHQKGRGKAQKLLEKRTNPFPQMLTHSHVKSGVTLNLAE